MPPAITSPTLLRDPGFLWIAPVATAAPTNTVAGSVFTDTVAVAWLPLGATSDGSTFGYSTSVEPIYVAELLDPVAQATTQRNGSLAFNLANWSLSNFRRALNGGIAALTPTSGTGATALYTVTPPVPGTEARCALLWESSDATVRIMVNQAIQGGEISAAFQKAPAYATIACTYNMEIPSGSTTPFTVWGAGANRG
jgi:hypothetical protein